MLVVNPNEGLKLCIDYKVTVNKYLENRNHPFPVKEFFLALQEEKKFSKLDFINAFSQLEISEN